MMANMSRSERLGPSSVRCGSGDGAHLADELVQRAAVLTCWRPRLHSPATLPPSRQKRGPGTPPCNWPLARHLVGAAQLVFARICDPQRSTTRRSFWPTLPTTRPSLVVHPTAARTWIATRWTASRRPARVPRGQVAEGSRRAARVPERPDLAPHRLLCALPPQGPRQASRCSRGNGGAAAAGRTWLATTGTDTFEPWPRVAGRDDGGNLV